MVCLKCAFNSEIVCILLRGVAHYLDRKHANSNELSLASKSDNPVGLREFLINRISNGTRFV